MVIFLLVILSILGYLAIGATVAIVCVWCATLVFTDWDKDDFTIFLEDVFVDYDPDTIGAFAMMTIIWPLILIVAPVALLFFGIRWFVLSVLLDDEEE